MQRPQGLSYAALRTDSSSDDSREGNGARNRFHRSSTHKVPLDWDEKPLHARPRKWWNRTRQLFFEKRSSYSWQDWLSEFLPCMVWLRTYDVRGWLLADVMAGISVACMEIPQGMSYASLAGLPYVFGLYGATIPCVVYCLFGSSRQLAVGPVAVTSMLLGAGLTEAFGGEVNQNPNAPADPALQAEYNRAAVQIAFLVGGIYTIVGLLRLGWLTNFLSHSVVSGFMSGASVIIASSQVKYVLGLQLPRADRLQDALRHIWEHKSEVSWAELTMSLSFMAILISFKVLARRSKRLTFLKAIGPLTVSALSILLMNGLHLYARPSRERPYIRDVGHMPQGLPAFTAGWWLPLKFPGAQLTLAVLVCLIDAVEAMSIAKSLAQVNGYELDATQDLRALGFSNLAGAAFNCYNTTGSFSRSAVNNDVGARTPLASGICGVLLMLTLLYITPVFTHMSKNVQGAIIIVGVLGLFDWRECVFLYQVNKPDFVVWLVAFLFTMFEGVESGIAASVGLALLMVIYKSAFPRIATLGRLPDTNPGLYRNRKMYPQTYEEPHMLLLRVDAPIYFANVQPVKEGIRKAVRKARQAQDVRFVIIDFSPVTDIDATAVHFLDSFLDELKGEGLQLALANPSQQVVALLRRSKLLDKIGQDNIHVNMHDAVELCRLGMEAEEQEGLIASLAGSANGSSGAGGSSGGPSGLVGGGGGGGAGSSGGDNHAV